MVSTVKLSNKKARVPSYPGQNNPGAPGAIRTRDTRFRRAVLYPLSYGGLPMHNNTIVKAYLSQPYMRKQILRRVFIKDKLHLALTL